MKPLRNRLDKLSRNTGIQLVVLERDYTLSWVLSGISRIESLKKNLIFKGGTALKKCYFGDYRFSEDLDFSALPGIARGAQLEALMLEACKLGASQAKEFSPFQIQCEQYAEKQPHPGGQEAFTIRSMFPWHRKPMASVFVEITTDEPVLTEPQELPVMHGYEEPLSANILAYSLDEIVLEKMRGILQYKAKLERRGWAQSRARDYYDLWRILDEHEDKVNMRALPGLFQDKCKARNVMFSDPGQFFETNILEDARKNWETSLAQLVPNRLPPFEKAANTLRTMLGGIFNI